MMIFDLSVKANGPLTPKFGASPVFFSLQVAKAQRFYLDLNPPRDVPLAVVCGGCEHCTPEYTINRSSFSYVSLELVVRGKGLVRLRGKPFSLQCGRLFCYGPGVSQQITTDPDEPLVKYFVDFSGTRARELLRSGHLALGQVIQVVAPSEVQSVFDELIRNGLKATRYSAEICVKLLECLVLKISESLAPLNGMESQSFVTFQACRQHLQMHFQRLRTLAQVTRECHINGAYLCRLFQRYDRQSPYQFLLRLKMNRAAELLQPPGALVKQIAEQVGFDDPFHFSRAFKSVFGVSPDTFRRLR